MSGFNNVLFSRNHYTPHYSTPYRIERVTIQLKDLDTTATIYPIFNINQAPLNLIKFLLQEYNDEILRGDSLPFFDKLTREEFQNYWFGQFTAVMCIGDEPDLSEELTVNEWAKRCLGSFFIKSAYPGRCSHICTTNFLVNAGIRHRGIGFYMCECFLRWAPILGYSRCIVDLIFETNVSMKRLLEKCGFSKVGKVLSCAMLKSTKDVLINSFIFTKELTIFEDDGNSSKHANILTYLLSGQYPENSNKEDRSRLRALAYHYQVINSKLYLKGKEVISDPDDQIKIIREIHNRDHVGINKTTSLISGKYYWSKIKSTVKKFVDKCEICRQGSNTRHSKLKRVKLAKENAAEIPSIPTLTNQRTDTDDNSNNNNNESSRNIIEFENQTPINSINNNNSNNDSNNKIIIPQSTTDLMNYINLSENSTYSSSSNYLSQPVQGKQRALINTLDINSTEATPTNQDLVSLLNYYNTASSHRNLDMKKYNNNGNKNLPINSGKFSNIGSKRTNIMAFGSETDFGVSDTRPSTTEDLNTDDNNINDNHNNNYGIEMVDGGDDNDDDDDGDYEYSREEDEDDDDDDDDYNNNDDNNGRDDDDESVRDYHVNGDSYNSTNTNYNHNKDSVDESDSYMSYSNNVMR